MEPRKVVVRYAAGRIVKGSTLDFSPNKPGFHLFPVGTGPPGKAIEVAIHELKAVFFVRDFAGRPQYEERKRFAETERPPGRKVEVTFPASNNLSIFVVFAAVRHIRDIAPAGRQGLSA